MKCTVCSFVLLVCLFASQSMAGNCTVVPLWPQGLPPDAVRVAPERIEALLAKQTPERVTYVENPSLTLYPAPADQANGCGVVVCPGGGYNILAWQKEGVELAQWFNTLGVTAVVLKYRVPRRHPDKIHWEPLQDAQRAIRLTRHHAKAWQIDPQRIGVLGFSAGGHLTAMTGMHWEKRTYPRVDAIDDLSCRPDYICPIYAAYLADGYQDDRAQLGSLVHVTAQTPPTFLAVTQDDTMRGVQAALLFAELTQAGVPAELHVYTRGGHGYGIRVTENPVTTWHHRLGEWLASQGFLKKQ